MLTNKFFRLMADIEEHAICTKALHFMINGAGDNIAGSQFATLVKIGHKA